MDVKKGFTLIELLAVIIILGVIMAIAVPNVISTIDRGKKEAYIEDAKRMIAAAEYKIRSDASIEYPNNNSVTIIPLSKLDNSEVNTSPYDNVYSKSKSFVAIVINVESGERIYYAHLISCDDQDCTNTSDNSVAKNRGIFLANLDQLNSSSRFDLVLKGTDVNTGNITSLESEIRSKLNKQSITIY